MTRKELSDNLSFLSALKMLERLAADGLLTEQEREKALRGMVSDEQMDTMLEDLDLGQGQERV